MSWQKLISIPVAGQLKNRIPELQLHAGLPEELREPSGTPSIIVLEDLMNEEQELLHHTIGMWAWSWVQNFFHKSSKCVTMDHKFIFF